MCLKRAFTHIQTHVRISDGILLFSTQPSDVTITQNMTATLQCSLRSSFYATIEWIFEYIGSGQAVVIANRQDSLYPRYSVLTSVTGLSLVIRSANYYTDQGLYTCRGHSIGKTISSSASMDIICEY